MRYIGRLLSLCYGRKVFDAANYFLYLFIWFGLFRHHQHECRQPLEWKITSLSFFLSSIHSAFRYLEYILTIHWHPNLLYCQWLAYWKQWTRFFPCRDLHWISPALSIKLTIFYIDILPIQCELVKILIYSMCFEWKYGVIWYSTHKYT